MVASTLAVISGISLTWAAAGAAAIAVPIIAHLLARRGGPIVDFPAVRFVARAASDQARRHRPRDLLLLLLRCAAVACLALAFDRPTWSARSAGPEEATGVDHVLVIDASASMMRTHRGRPLFEIARDRAREALADLDPAADRAAVVIAAMAPEPLLPRLTANVEALRAALDAAEPTLERADLTAAIRLAGTLPPTIDESTRARRITIIGDRQLTQWADVRPLSGLDVTFVPVGPEEVTPNLAVLDLSIAPPRPVAGEPAVATVTIANFGDAPAAPVVTFEGPDGQRRATPSLAAGARTSIAFRVTFPEAGQAGIAAGLVDASYTVDDRAERIVDVRAAARIGLVTAAALDDPSAAALYVAVAMAPDEPATLEPVALDPAGLSSAVLADLDAVVIVGAGSLDEHAVGALRDFLDAGGGVLWMIDGPEAMAAARRFEDVDPETADLPVTLDPSFQRLADAVHLRRAVPDHPALRAFEGPASSALPSIAFAAIAPATTQPHGVTLLPLRSGRPLAAFAPVGDGRLITLLADLSPAESNLVKSPMFPVLLHELLAWLRPMRGVTAVPVVGEPIIVAIPDVDGIAEPLVDDRQSPVRLSISRSAITGMRAGVATVDPYAAPGIGRLVDASGAEVRAFAVRLDPAESDTRPAAPEALREIFDTARASVTLAQGGPGAVLGADTRPIELWPLMIVACAFFLAMESLTAAWTRRRIITDGGDA